MHSKDRVESGSRFEGDVGVPRGRAERRSIDVGKGDLTSVGRSFARNRSDWKTRFAEFLRRVDVESRVVGFADGGTKEEAEFREIGRGEIVLRLEEGDSVLRDCANRISARPQQFESVRRD